MKPILPVLLLVLLALPAAADDGPAFHLARFGAGDGPREVDGTIELLDQGLTPQQSNAVAYDRQHEGAYASLVVRSSFRALEGGDGGAFCLLSTREYGTHGPAPFVPSWVEPNLRGTFAVGIDVHDPKNEEPFGPWGNYLGLPEREVSLHWDGREIVKRVAPTEFRGDFATLGIEVRHVAGGAEVTVRIGEGVVYDRYFLAGMIPYESRLAVGAGTRADATTRFDVKDLAVEVGALAERTRPPLHVEVFNHVLTDNKKTAFDQVVSLPPANWAFGRVILTLEIHDAGPDWDEWDRVGEVFVVAEDGTKHGIVPFITSYRTPCHWQVDVTHFRPLLTGETRLQVAAGTSFYKNRGYMMSVSLDFHHGKPELDAYEVVPLWHGRASYKSAENHFQDFFTPRAVTIPQDVAAARVFTTTTGHSQIGEFTPSTRTLVFHPVKGGEEARAKRFENRLWKADCYLNPNRPQYGTWKFARAGWAPGDVVRPWWVDLTPHLERGAEAELRYETQPYDFEGAPRAPTAKQINEANQIVRSYLILYRDPASLVPAPTLRIGSVAKDSNAARAGMKAGDYLVSYDGTRIDTLEDLRAAMQAAQAAEKEKVEVEIFRDGERQVLELDAGRMGVNLGG